jgi:hypothetical protein
MSSRDSKYDDGEDDDMDVQTEAPVMSDDEDEDEKNHRNSTIPDEKTSSDREHKQMSADQLHIREEEERARRVTAMLPAPRRGTLRRRAHNPPGAFSRDELDRSKRRRLELYSVLANNFFLFTPFLELSGIANATTASREIHTNMENNEPDTDPVLGEQKVVLMNGVAMNEYTFRANMEMLAMEFGNRVLLIEVGLRRRAEIPHVTRRAASLHTFAYLEKFRHPPRLSEWTKRRVRTIYIDLSNPTVRQEILGMPRQLPMFYDNVRRADRVVLNVVNSQYTDSFTLPTDFAALDTSVGVLSRTNFNTLVLLDVSDPFVLIYWPFPMQRIPSCRSLYVILSRTLFSDTYDLDPFTHYWSEVTPNLPVRPPVNGIQPRARERRGLANASVESFSLISMHPEISPEITWYLAVYRCIQTQTAMRRLWIAHRRMDIGYRFNEIQIAAGYRNLLACPSIQHVTLLTAGSSFFFPFITFPNAVQLRFLGFFRAIDASQVPVMPHLERLHIIMDVNIRDLQYWLAALENLVQEGKFPSITHITLERLGYDNAIEIEEDDDVRASQRRRRYAPFIEYATRLSAERTVTIRGIDHEHIRHRGAEHNPVDLSQCGELDEQTRAFLLEQNAHTPFDISTERFTDYRPRILRDLRVMGYERAIDQFVRLEDIYDQALRTLDSRINILDWSSINIAMGQLRRDYRLENPDDNDSSFDSDDEQAVADASEAEAEAAEAEAEDAEAEAEAREQREEEEAELNEGREPDEDGDAQPEAEEDEESDGGGEESKSDEQLRSEVDALLDGKDDEEEEEKDDEDEDEEEEEESDGTQYESDGETQRQQVFTDEFKAVDRRAATLFARNDRQFNGVDPYGDNDRNFVRDQAFEDRDDAYMAAAESRAADVRHQIQQVHANPGWYPVNRLQQLLEQLYIEEEIYMYSRPRDLTNVSRGLTASSSSTPRVPRTSGRARAPVSAPAPVRTRTRGTTAGRLCFEFSHKLELRK